MRSLLWMLLWISFFMYSPVDAMHKSFSLPIMYVDKSKNTGARTQQQNTVQANVCAICLEPLHDHKHFVYVFPCHSKHGFHEVCARKMIHSGQASQPGFVTCPFCRAQHGVPSYKLLLKNSPYQNEQILFALKYATVFDCTVYMAIGLGFMSTVIFAYLKIMANIS